MSDILDDFKAALAAKNAAAAGDAKMEGDLFTANFEVAKAESAEKSGKKVKEIIDHGGGGIEIIYE